ncbi:hypothetical protein PNEG_01973 [Pneumocystis murina B123]|uniref:Protein PNS1 n=1 Tax=Pneumocystis murina (strain B123) TaxID=1069680 RepID=M7P7G9_PNEMU|nr:hypothetical protein PNEG_01973 [Pneumocystis murina B123]EMR09790.1 hypothetical protein PNEG_01973 [Pneumocystis murina B123]
MNVNAEKSYGSGNPYYYKMNQGPEGVWMPDRKEVIEFSEKFKVDKKWKDVWASILFFISLIGFIYISGVSIHDFLNTDEFKKNGFSGGSSFTVNSNTVFLYIYVIGSASVLSFFYFLLARIYTKQFILLTGILQIVLMLAIGIFYLIRGLYVVSIVFLVFVIFYAFCFYTWRSRIPLATMYLQFTMKVSSHYPSVYFVSFCGMIVSIGFFAWFFITLVTSYNKFSEYEPNGLRKQSCIDNPNKCGSSYLHLVLLYIFFNAYWITEVIKNVVHTTICGVFGSYYYGYNTPEGIPKHATLSSLKRTTTYSFGSICFGSLVASIVQLLRDIFKSVMRDRAGSGDIIGTIFSCFASCILMLLDWLVQYFNHYCYAQIALYGKKYLKAAKDTWDMFRRTGIDALINDCLIDNVLFFGSLFVACLTAFSSFLYLRFTNPVYNSNGTYYIGVIFVAFFIGLQICNIAVIAIKSGIAALFVGVSEDREVLRRNFPVLYNQMFGTV